MRRLVAFFREPPAAPPLADPAAIAATYRHFRIRMLYGSLVGYALFYFTRKNVAVALPLLSRDLHYTNAELGILGTLLYASYGLAKGLFGFLGDRADPRRMMAVGLALSAAMNVLFGLSSGLAAFGAWWLLNGVFQAMGAPACAKICVRWYSVSERGTMWGIWNISHQAGGGAILLVAGQLGAHLGWRAVFLGPAVLCLLGTWFVLDRLRDRPEALGLPPIDVYRRDPETGPGVARGVPAAEGFLALVVRRILLNPRMLLVALGSMCVYVARYGTLDWGTKYLVEAKSQSVAWASGLTSLVEFLGIPGSLVAGVVSDRLFGARRAPICILFLVGLAASIAALWAIPPGHPHLDACALGAIGFFTYGPQMLLAGVAAADTAGTEVAAAAVGVTGTLSYLGAMISAYGTGALVDAHGWGGGFVLWIVAALAGAVVIAPLWNARGRQA